MTSTDFKTSTPIGSSLDFVKTDLKEIPDTFKNPRVVEIKEMISPDPSLHDMDIERIYSIIKDKPVYLIGKSIYF